jgi:hypothetical protein
MLAASTGTDNQDSDAIAAHLPPTFRSDVDQRGLDWQWGRLILNRQCQPPMMDSIGCL